MEFNEQTELKSKIESDSQMESRLTALVCVVNGYGVEGLSKKEKGLMDTVNSVIAGVRGV